MTAITKDIRLNAEKRKTLVQHYENHLRNSDNKFRKAMIEAKENYDNMKDKIFELAHNVVRSYQPQEDVDTIKKMRAKYNSSGGDIHKDSCFNFINPSMETDERGNAYENDNQIHVDFSLNASNRYYSSSSKFANAYYYDELKAKGLDADYQYRWKEEKRNPRYYEEENKVREYLGFNRSNENNDSSFNPKNDWEEKYSIDVIGTSHCGSRQFRVDDTTHSVFNTFKIACEKVSQTHEEFFEYLNKKVKTFEQGIKTYTKYSQAKELFDKLGIPLNESMINEQSSMALSVFNPTNLADMLADKDDEFASREEKIAHFKALQSASIN
jgi:hypothetical protein